MFCNNCGKQIPNGAKFCNECGAQQPQMNANPNPRPSYQQPPQNQQQYQQPPQNQQQYQPSNPQPAPAPAPAAPAKKKGGKNIFSMILVAIVVFACMYFIFGGDDGILAKSGSETFEMTDTSGNHIVIELHYKGDTVVKLVKADHYPMPEGVTEEDAKNQMKMQYVSHEMHDFVTATYNLEGDYFVVKLTYNDLDNESNAFTLGTIGIADIDEFGELLSFKECKKDLIDQGFVKK